MPAPTGLLPRQPRSIRNAVADTDWQIEKLDRAHERATFSCGQPLLDEWLRRFASQYEQPEIWPAPPTLLCGPARRGARLLFGFEPSSGLRRACTEEQAKGLPSIVIPVVLLGRLAVDKSVQGQGLGEFLLLDALRIATHVAQHAGSARAVEVHAIDDAALAILLKIRLRVAPDYRRHLFLPMHVVRQLRLPPF